MSIRKAFLMRLKPGHQAEYERRHNPVWPEMEETLRAYGARNYSIYLDPQTDNLFGYVEIDSESRWEEIAADPVCRRWWRHMQEMMETHEDARPVAIPLVEVFHLD
ncbi:MAG: L-rhamnose mutarotase [Acidobacteriota bacterium]